MKLPRECVLLYDDLHEFVGKLRGVDTRLPRRHVFKRGTIMVGIPAGVLHLGGAVKAHPFRSVVILNPRRHTWVKS